MVTIGPCTTDTYMNTHIGYFLLYTAERGDGEGAPIHTPMIRVKTSENHRKYCLTPSNKFILKKHCTNHTATEDLVAEW